MPIPRSTFLPPRPNAADLTVKYKLDSDLRRAVAWVAAINLGYFAVEFSAALHLGSVSLFADSIDFLEDSSINLLILMGLGWNAAKRAALGRALAAIILVPGIATLWQAWEKFNLPIAPDPVFLSLVGAGAFAANLACALILVSYRSEAGSLTRAAFPVGEERCTRQCRDHRRRHCDGAHEIRLARSDRRPWNCHSQR